MAFQPSAHSYRSAVIAMPTAQQMARLNPKTGLFYEGGYGYHYNAVTGDITIVLSPRSASQTKMTKGSSAYKAVLSQIESGVAAPISSEELKAKRVAIGDAPSLMSSITQTFVAPTSQAPELLSGPSESIPFYKHPFFFPIAISGTALVLGTIFILTRD